MVELLGKQVKRSWYSMIKSLLVLTVLSLLSPLEKAEKSTFLFSAIDPQYEKEALSLNQSEVTEFGPFFSPCWICQAQKWVKYVIVLPKMNGP
jgi:hypothetical protein